MTTTRDLNPAMKRCLKSLSTASAKKMSASLQSLIELGLAEPFEKDGATLYRRTPAGVRMQMELHRIERLLYTVDSSGKKTRRPWKR